jgi:3'(2'),5'-bisphosphate nucleotidase
MSEKDLKKRLKFAIKVAKIAGDVLLKLREWKSLHKFTKGSQVKSFADAVSEKLIISLIEAFYLKDPILSEENYEKNKKFIPSKEFWIFDSLDGTASYCQGYDGFCVQIAYIKNGKPVIGIVHAPLMGLTYWAIAGRGAYLTAKNETKKLLLKKRSSFNKTYIDNQPAKGNTAKALEQVGVNKFLELGSYGLKICKVAEGEADIFLKSVEFKIWDTAPGDLILEEAGGKLTLWDGNRINYSGKKIYFKNLVAASLIYHKEILSYL